MDYEDAIDAIVSREEARREIAQHCTGLDGRVIESELAETWQEFAEDCGDHPTYLGKTVLDWLGY